MTSASAAPADVLGAQRPRICHVPEYASSSGEEAVALARMAGLVLDPWQEFVLGHALGERPDGQWAAFEIGLVVPRQNGKGGLLEARELAGLFLLDERLVVHSAHQFDTSLEAYRRLRSLIQETPALDKRVKRYVNSHGEEGIELKNGQRIRFRTRTKGGGRGFTGDCLILDEAMILPETAMGALMPTLSARPNPQLWYTGSAVDQDVHEDGVVFARVRERGLKGGDPSLAYFEWSIDADTPTDVSERVAKSPQSWAQSNPALGIRITPEYAANEQRSMAARTFAVERLGVGDWPRTDGMGESTISREAWDALRDTHSQATGAVCFAFDVTICAQSNPGGSDGNQSNPLCNQTVGAYGFAFGLTIDNPAMDVANDARITGAVVTYLDTTPPDIPSIGGFPAGWVDSLPNLWVYGHDGGVGVQTFWANVNGQQQTQGEGCASPQTGYFCPGSDTRYFNFSNLAEGQNANSTGRRNTGLW